jgi:hypothetical protein
VCTTPQEWAKAAGASPEVTEALRKRMQIGATGNANFMLGLTASIAVLMLVIGLAAFFFAR